MKKTGAVHVDGLQGFSVTHPGTANTQNVCQLLNGVTILLQGRKERMTGGIRSPDSFVFVITPPPRSSSSPPALPPIRLCLGLTLSPTSAFSSGNATLR